MHPTPQDAGAAETNRSLRAIGVVLIVASFVLAGWLLAGYGSIVTAVEVLLFVLVGVALLGLGKIPDSES